MILHRLLWRFARHQDDAAFYALQATDAIRWLGTRGVRIGTGVRALDLGSGHGVFGGELARMGCSVTFADEQNLLLPEHRQRPFLAINLDRDALDGLGRHDLVVCSNVLEHLGRPREFLQRADQLLAPGGHLYLSWTNWLSPWDAPVFIGRARTCSSRTSAASSAGYATTRAWRSSPWHRAITRRRVG